MDALAVFCAMLFYRVCLYPPPPPPKKKNLQSSRLLDPNFPKFQDPLTSRRVTLKKARKPERLKIYGSNPKPSRKPSVAGTKTPNPPESSSN